MSALPALPPQAPATPWPVNEWPRAALDPATKAALDALLGEAFAPKPGAPDMGEAHAFLAIKAGKIVAERYAGGVHTAASTYPSWSMAKSITVLLIGFLVAEGRIDIDAPLAAPEWSAPGDPRAAVTWRSLLHMTSGLSFIEDYVPGSVSDVIEMLFGAGKTDVAHYAASRPLAHTPDTVFNYASGTSNILARALGAAIGGGEAGMRAFMEARLFGPLGIEGAEPKFDEAGTFIGSSYCFLRAEDFARIGLLALRGGVWNGAPLLPASWIDFARTQGPVPLPRDQYPDGRGYGGHWWLGQWGPGSFSMNGYAGQYCLCVPDLDLIVVRHGNSVNEGENTRQERVADWLRRVVACFRG
jgi:CubicO group peptidase (beta-lactamase class C family)